MFRTIQDYRSEPNMLKVRTLCTLLFLFAASFAVADNNSAPDPAAKDYYRSIQNSNPKGREVHFNYVRAYPYDRIPFGARTQAMAQAEAMRAKTPDNIMAEQPQWRSLGPGEVGGRVRSVVVHPTNPNIAYIGTASGGAWKTVDGGDSWTPIFDNQTAIAFGSLALDPANPDVIYAATGEMSSNIDAYLGDGVFRSEDAGQSWEPLGLTNVGAFSKIYVHPSNSNYIIAGATKNGAGLYISRDRGASWERVFEGQVSDVALHPSNEQVLFIGVTGTGIYRSQDGGENWTLLSSTNGLPFYNFGRVCVQRAESDPNIMYMLTELTVQGNEVATVYRSSDGGTSWSPADNGLPASMFISGGGTQSWYDMHLVISPHNADVLWAGGIGLYRSTNGGSSWTTRPIGHVDQHHLAYAPSDANRVYAANDGGMYVSTNGGTSFNSANNGLEITQFYHLAIDQSRESVQYGGTQDNGTVGSFVAPSWRREAGGDGGQVVVNESNPNIIYGEFQNGGLWRRNVATEDFVSITNGIPSDEVDDSYWIGPIATMPGDANIVFHGRSNLYVTFNSGGFWEPASILFPTFDDAENMTAIALSPINLQMMVGTQNGGILRSRDITNFEDISANGIANRFITSIYFSRNNADRVWVTLGGFGTPHVYRTDNFGDTWVNISKTLPDIPVSSIVSHPDNENYLWVGTDVGVFATYDGGQSWFPYGEGLPRVPIAGIDIHLSSNTLRVATHGRSMWEADLIEDVDDQGITAPTGGENYVHGSAQVLSWFGFTGAVSVEYSLDNGQEWNPIASGILGGSMLWAVPNTPTFTARIRVTSDEDPSEFIVSNRFSIDPIDNGVVLGEGGVGFVPYGIAYDRQGSLWATSFYGNKLYKLNATTFEVQEQFVMPEGDSLFTGITFNPESGNLYVHRMLGSSGNDGGMIYEIAQDGSLVRQFESPGNRYPIGLAWVGNNRLAVGDRDSRRLYMLNVSSNLVEQEVDNPFTKSSGPRGLCYNAEDDMFYQVSTDFTGGTLQAAYALEIQRSPFGSGGESLPLEGRNGNINARGIDINPDNKSFWISDFSGNLYRIAGFDLDKLVSVEEVEAQTIETTVYPNPTTESFSLDIAEEHAGTGKVLLLDERGALVSTLFQGSLVGTHMFELPEIASGAYTVSVALDSGKTLKAMLIVIR